MSKRLLVVVVGLCTGLIFVSCGGRPQTNKRSGLPHRVLASQGVSATTTFGGLFFVNGDNDTIPRVSPLPAGSSPGFMVTSPTRNIVATFDSISNTAFAVDTTQESSIGAGVKLPGSTSSMVIPTASATGFAAVPTATVNGFAFQGAVESMNFATNSLTTIAVTNAQTVVSNSQGTELLVFAADSDNVTVLSPASAVPPVDTTCLTSVPNVVTAGSSCAIIQDPSFSRPVNAIVNGTTAYILSCGTECGGSAFNGSNPVSCGSNTTVVAQACISVFDLGSLTVTQSIPVDAATMALLNGSTLYVAGTPASLPCPSSQNTAAPTCGMLDVVDLASAQVTSSAAVTDGYHDHMDLTANGQLFLGSRNCSNIGNVNNPGPGEIRGCLSIYKTADGSVVFPPDNGDVTGLQAFTSRNVEYVAEGGQLRVYDTTKDKLLINDFVPQGTIDIVGFVGDVKAIDFF